jgi:phosphoglycolate phosphatase-like HAD superfamily hydrolase
MILEGLRRLNGVAGCSAMVGDQPIDIAAARAAGLGRAVLIDREQTAAGAAAGADAVARSLDDAVKNMTSPRARCTSS